MIDYNPKSIFYQLAMLCFLVATVSSNKIKIRCSVMLAYLFLIIWEYTVNGTVTIDVILWTITFYCLNLFMIFQ